MKTVNPTGISFSYSANATHYKYAGIKLRGLTLIQNYGNSLVQINN